MDIKYTSSIKELGKSAKEINIVIPWKSINEKYHTIFTKLINEIEAPGFRKGKAPKNVAEKYIDRKKVYEEVIREVIPDIYSKVLKEYNLNPISSPKIELVKAKENEDWEIKVVIALKPQILLNDYKTKIKNLKNQTTKIWTPGQDKEQKEQKKPDLNAIIQLLLNNIDFEIPVILIEEEVNRQLADLVDQTKLLGLTVEQYLRAKGKTIEDIRKEYNKQAENTIKIQFILMEIADQEKITVEEKDFEKAFSSVKSEAEKEKLTKDRYYLAHILRQQKTIDYLLNL
jgi:trigger factor